LTLYRAGQEALTNIAKHANATIVSVRLNYVEDRTRLTIEDNGVGATDSEGGFGLLGIRERVQLLNGSVRVSTDAGKGFILEVEVPE
jgi:signal transduction histidine kinase